VLTGFRGRQHHLTMKANVSRLALVAAYGIAVCADLMEMSLSLVFSEGFMSPFDDVMDAVVCVILTLLLGWHLAFLPSFAVKLIPVADLAPTWTIAVLIATRGWSRSAGKIPDNPKPLSPPVIPEEKPPGALPESKD
jgi:K+ transporter